MSKEYSKTKVSIVKFYYSLLIKFKSRTLTLVKNGKTWNTYDHQWTPARLAAAPLFLTISHIQYRIAAKMHTLVQISEE